ncbi:MAG: hypothetical protein AMXMBFR33_31030 [Candidatus Xenobia bacterium]
MIVQPALALSPAPLYRRAVPSAAAPPDPTDRAELSAGLSQPVDAPGIWQRTAEWTAGLVGSLWRLLVVGCKVPEEPVPVEPVQKFSNPSVEGVVVNGERVHHPDLEGQRVHTYALTTNSDLALLRFDQLLETGRPEPPPHRYRYIPEKSLTRDVNQAHEARHRSVEAPRPRAGDRVVPKDASLDPAAYAMYCDGSDLVTLDYVNQMAQVGQIEGYHVLANVPRGSVKELRGQVDENVSLLPISMAGDIWTEDYGEMTLQGGVAVPAFLDDPELVPQSIYKDRIRRFYPGARIPANADYESLVLSEYPLAAFNIQGSVSQGNLQWGLAALARSANKPVRENLSHVEGGNILFGTLPNHEGYALVGKDSLAVTRAKLSLDLGREVSDQTALSAIARDHGQKAPNVYAVEQPGEFHIDMRMMCLGPGEVVLNDAREAAEVQVGWLKHDIVTSKPRHPGPESSVWQRLNYHRKLFFHKRRERRLHDQIVALREEGERRAYFEDLTARDLKTAGLTVHRMAGVFVDPENPTEDMFNFVNGRPGVDRANQRFFVGLGGDSRSEVYVARKLMQGLPTGIVRLHFLDRELTPSTLGLFGGIKCRTKPEGELVSKQQLKSPSPPQLAPAP